MAAVDSAQARVHHQFVIYGGSMKTLIVGTGIIGTIYGWALSEAGVDVTHFVRKGKKEQFKDGVTLDLLDERKGHPKNSTPHYQLNCVEEIASSDGYELIIVPTNVHQTENALEMLAPVSGQVVFLVFSGNWEGTAFIDRLLPRERYLLGYADGGGTIRNGVYWTNLGGEVHLGEVDGQSTEKLEKVKVIFARADIQVDVQENIVHWLWTHIARVVGFAAGFAKHRDVQEYLKDKALVRQCILSTRELYKLCQLRGVDLKKYPEAGFMNFPVWLVAMLLRWNFSRNESMQRYTAHAASEGSLQETKVYRASMIKTAEELGFDMPHTRAGLSHKKSTHYG
jgi:ketopantoate reductase